MGKILEMLDKNDSVLSSNDPDDIMLLIVKDKKTGQFRVGCNCESLVELEQIILEAIRTHDMLSAPILSGFTRRFLEIYNGAFNKNEE